ncbi:MAG: hypothetical protein ACO34F_09230 [Burkholderiaceae bacterium]
MKIPKFGEGSELDLLRQAMGASQPKPLPGRKPMLFHPDFIHALGKPKLGVDITAAELAVRRALHAKQPSQRYTSDEQAAGVYQPEAGAYDPSAAATRREDGVLRPAGVRSGRVIKPR